MISVIAFGVGLFTAIGCLGHLTLMVAVSCGKVVPASRDREVGIPIWLMVACVVSWTVFYASRSL